MVKMFKAYMDKLTCDALQKAYCIADEGLKGTKNYKYTLIKWQ